MLVQPCSDEPLHYHDWNRRRRRRQEPQQAAHEEARSPKNTLQQVLMLVQSHSYEHLLYHDS